MIFVNSLNKLNLIENNGATRQHNIEIIRELHSVRVITTFTNLILLLKSLKYLIKPMHKPKSAIVTIMPERDKSAPAFPISSGINILEHPIQ